MNQEKFKKSHKACFLDRDGVINEDIGNLYKVKDFKWIDGAQNAINYLKKNGYLVIVVTNQSGVKRKFYSKSDVNKLHNWMNKELKENYDTFIDDFFFSTDLPNSDINSDRKPSPIIINNAVKKYNLQLNHCFLVGDKPSDIQSAKNAGIKGFLFKKGNLLDKVKKIIQDHFN